MPGPNDSLEDLTAKIDAIMRSRPKPLLGAGESLLGEGKKVIDEIRQLVQSDLAALDTEGPFDVQG
jgi:hypothetical protein